MLKDLGRVYSRQTPSGQTKPIHRFLCDCGTEFQACIYNVRTGGTKSCGCLAKRLTSERTRTHGAAVNGEHTPEYRSYRNMLTRGRNPRINSAHHYVGRGIGVADEWLPGGDGSGFARFLDHVGPRPSQKHSLDRIDVNRGYEPGNVRWATAQEQAVNRRGAVIVNYNGTDMPLIDACRLSGIPYGVLRDRMCKLGWPEHRWFEPRARAAFGEGKCARPGVAPRPDRWASTPP